VSLSRAEVEAMDRDELIETIIGMRDTVDDLQLSVDVLIERVNDSENRIDELESEVSHLREQATEAEVTAKGAYRAANQGQADQKSKTQIAHDITRNLLVAKAARDAPAADRPVTVADVREKARPDHDLRWQTVRNAWDGLLEKWPQFYETADDGDQAVSIRPDEVSPALAKTVQADLDRDDLAKRFVGNNGGRSP